MIASVEIESVQNVDEASEEVVKVLTKPKDQADDQTVDQNEANRDDSEMVANSNINNPKPILYNLNISPVVRCVKIVARLINLELEIRDLDIFNGEHLNEPFIKINPEHTVPTLMDGDFIVWDSHAIAIYLIDKYADNDALYPKDLCLRARCNQRLFFNNGILFPRFRAISKLIFSGGSDTFPDEFIESIQSTYETLTAFLASDPFLVGTQLTVADIYVCVIISCLAIVAAITDEQYPEIVAWMDRIKEEIPFFDEINEPYVKEFNEIITAKMDSNGAKE